MSTPQFCVSWVSYKTSLFRGLSSLQQNGEFVDMTLAAEGYLVKVHQNIVALASPYIKAMIQSAACQHPVVFLNNISHEVLGFILEYIYMGEVKIATDMMPMFIQACKALHINGVENIDIPKKKPTPEFYAEKNEPTVQRITEVTDNNFAAHIKINSDNYNVEVIPIDYNGRQEISIENNIRQDQNLPIINIDDETSYFDTLSCVNFDTQVNQIEIDPSPKIIISNTHTHKKVKTLLPGIGSKDKTHHYSTSNRGSLQLLLKHYIYHCHHNSCGGRRRRWRCADYRKLHCPAFIDTHDDTIITTSENHSHSNHNARILRKFKNKTVFTSLSEAEEKVSTTKVKGPKTVIRRKPILSAETNNLNDLG